MERQSRGFSLNKLSKYYDLIAPTEKSKFRREQIGWMDIQEGEKILEVGCGTGSLAILAKISGGENGEVAGVDIAPKMIHRAQEKADRAKLKIAFKTGSIAELPYPDEYFDLVISSLMFHHLPPEIKKKGLKEIHRVLKPEGRMFLCDFCSPHVLTFPLAFFMLIWMSSTRYQLFGKLPALIRACHFKKIELKKKGLFLEYYLIRKN